MEDCLNEELHTLLILTRNRLEPTQAAMAKRYFMAKNTYWDLEADNHGFSLLTAFLLLHDQEDPKKVPDGLAAKIKQALKEVNVLI